MGAKSTLPEGFTEADSLAMLDEPEAHDRFCYLIDHIAYATGAVIAWKNDELLPIRQDGKWAVAIWPNEQVARLSIGDQYQDVSFSVADPAKLLDQILPDMEAAAEVISAFPDRDFHCLAYEPAYFRECLEDELRSRYLWERHEAGSLTKAEQIEFNRRFQIRNIADIEIHERAKAKLQARKKAKSDE
jgi:hypothetical protein